MASDEVARLRRRVARAKKALRAAEELSERTTRELYDQRAELALVERVFVASNEATSVEDAMQRAIDEICAHTGWPVGHVWMRAEGAGEELAPTGLWFLDDPARYEAFRRVTMRTRFRSGVGLPGRVLESGQPVWIVDVAAERDFHRAGPAREAGLRAAFCFPVVLDGEVLGVLDFFFPHAVEPIQGLLERMEHIGTHLGRVIGRRRAETALRQAEAKYRSLVERLPAITYIAGFGASGRWRYVSPQIETMLGYTPEQWLADPDLWFERMHPDDREHVLAEEDRSRASGGPLVSEYRLYARDGTLRWLRDEALVVEDEEHGSGWLQGVIFDLTERVHAEHERVRLEARLRQSERLESVGQLAGGIAHDFNNLLAVILNYASFASGELEDGTPVQQDVEEIRRAAERAAALTRQLLVFSRREIVTPAVLDLNAVVADMDALLRRTLGEQVDFQTKLHPDLPPVKADPGQLEQVLVNLAVNARDAMPDGGTLTIETANVELDSGQARESDVASGRYAGLIVSDTGSGIRPDIVERVFEPFFTTKQKWEGTGLGLATVYGIVRQAGGCIDVHSEPGVGTTFKVNLPAAEEGTAVARQNESEPVPAGRNESVLVVEDEAQVRELTRRILSGHGYNVLEAADAGEGLRTWELHDGRIDLVVTDVVMPRMSGRELVQRLRDSSSDPKVLYISGYTEDFIARKGVLEDDVMLLEKPFTAEELLRAVGAALAGDG